MTTRFETPPSNLVDDPQAPEFYASNFSGIQVAHGNATITLESARMDHSTDGGGVNRVVVARIVLPVAAAQSLAQQLRALLNQGGLGRIAAVRAAKIQ